MGRREPRWRPFRCRRHIDCPRGLLGALGQPGGRLRALPALVATLLLFVETPLVMAPHLPSAAAGREIVGQNMGTVVHRPGDALKAKAAK